MTQGPSAPRLFAYGSLLLPEVMEAVVGRRLPRRRASLPGYARRALVDAVYPGIGPSRGAHTRGVVYEGLGPRDWARLDRFEGDLYDRRRVVVACAGARRSAATYVVRPPHRHRLAAEDWDPDEFAVRHRARYLAGCRAWARRDAS